MTVKLLSFPVSTTYYDLPHQVSSYNTSCSIIGHFWHFYNYFQLFNSVAGWKPNMTNEMYADAFQQAP